MADYRELLQIKDSVEGLEIAEGAYKTSRGTIRIPKSRLKKQHRESETQEVEQEAPLGIPEAPVNTEKLAQKVVGQSDRVSFTTPLGTMTALYNPVIDLDDFVVLGLVPNSFVPTCWRENKELRFIVKGTKLKECQVIFTGCKFTDPFTRATYIVLMKT